MRVSACSCFGPCVVCVFVCVCEHAEKKAEGKPTPYVGGTLGGGGWGGDAVWIVSFTQINTAFVVFPGMCHVACWRQRPFGAIGVGAKCVSGLR